MSSQLRIRTLALILAALWTQAGFAAVVDSQAGDPNGKYVNIEFSPDGRHAIFIEGLPQANGSVRYKAWLSQVDQASGQLMPADGRGHDLGNAMMAGMPQFGQDSTGTFAVMLNEAGNLVRVRPNGGSAPTVQTFLDNIDSREQKLRRAFPYPSRNPGSSLQYVTYQVRSPAGGDMLQRLVELTLQPNIHREVRRERVYGHRSPALIVNFARWIQGTFSFTIGAYADQCLGTSAQCPSQLLRLDVTPTGSPASLVTNDFHHKVDAFPFPLQGGGTGLIGGLDLAAEGGFYTYDDRQHLFQLTSVIQKPTSQTELALPGMAQSFEPFTWKGEQYAAYQLVETVAPNGSSLASSYAGEIWVAKLGASPLSCRVSLVDNGPEKRARVDAEPVLYQNGERVTLYYHSTAPTPAGQPMMPDLRRIDLGDKAGFDAACAAGTAFKGCIPGEILLNGACRAIPKRCPNGFFPVLGRCRR